MKHFPRQFGARWLIGLGMGLALAVSAGAAAQTLPSSGEPGAPPEALKPAPSKPSDLLRALYPEPSENPLNREALDREFGPPVPILAPLLPVEGPIMLDAPPPPDEREVLTLGGSTAWQARFEIPGLPFRLMDPALAPPEPLPDLPPAAELEPQPAAPPEPVFKVNEAGLDEIAAALDLDPRLARYLVYFRTIHGSFRTPADLSEVFGITDADARRWEARGLLVLR